MKPFLSLCPETKGGVNVVFLLNPPGLTGLEPAASALTGRCSDQLNYNPMEIKWVAYIFLLMISFEFEIQIIVL